MSLLARAPGARLHARVAAALPALRCVELAPPPAAAPALGAARVVAWNAERGRFPEAAARMLRASGAEALLLSELDVGMARSQQRHTARELALRLGLGFAFGVEFLELGLGNAAERERSAGEENAVGYHGGAVASARPLERPVLVRLDAGGDWFDGRRGERRVASTAMRPPTRRSPRRRLVRRPPASRRTRTGRSRGRALATAPPW